jgi:hypothetical protein
VSLRGPGLPGEGLGEEALWFLPNDGDAQKSPNGLFLVATSLGPPTHPIRAG